MIYKQIRTLKGGNTMAILESIHFEGKFRFRFLINYGYRLTTPHIHSEYEIIYVEKGSINLGVDNELFRLKENEVFVIRPYLEHYIVPDSESIRHVFQCDETLFRNNFMNDFSKKMTDLSPVSHYWDKKVADQIVSSLKSIRDEYNSKSVSYEIQILSDLYKIFVLLTRYECEGNIKHKESKKMKTLKEVFQYVGEHYKEKIYIEEIADFLGYSTEYFSRFFKKNTGLNFTDFLLDYRLTSAKWELLTTDYSINQIIYNNGFSNTATFYRNFKELTGYSPKEFRILFKSQ